MVMRKMCYKGKMFAGVLVFLFGYAVFDGCSLRRRKKSCLLPLTRPILVFHANPKVFFSSISDKNPN